MIENEAVNSEWNRCRHYIEAALAHSPGLESIDDVERRLEDGSYMLWTGDECALVTQLVHYPAKKIFEVMHAGGSKREIIYRLGPVMEEYARKNGCDLMAAGGRKGWLREGERHGWHLGYVTMMKSLRH